MRKAFPRSLVLLAIDANARVGSETCDNIGGAGAEKETESGQLFRIMLNRTSMYAVNTFWDAAWTLQSTKITTSKIDFVCCDVACGDKVLDCRVVDEVDLTMDASVDHRMIMMTMHVDVCVKEQKRGCSTWASSTLANGRLGPIRLRPIRLGPIRVFST